MQFERILEVRERFLFCLALAGNVDFQALGYVPRPLPPDRCREWTLHAPILPHPLGSVVEARRTVRLTLWPCNP